MNDTDLFGPVPRQNPSGIGYAGRPGEGPDGETCGSCYFRESVAFGDGIYHKCGHGRGRISASSATDIRITMPACQYWEAS